MTIGIAVSGPMAGLATFMALRAVERVARGALGGFVSFVALDDDGQLLTACTQRGGTTTLFTEAEATGVMPPPAVASARLAGLISSGPNRPEPLIQFTPADPAAGLVTGHRLPNMPGPGPEGERDGPVNRAVLERLRQGDSPKEAVEAVLAAHPRADAGLIALARDGRIYAADSELVQKRPDRGRFLGEDPATGARCAVLHNSIFPITSIAPLAAAIAFDAIAPADRVDFQIMVRAGTRLEKGAEACLHLTSGERVSHITVEDAIWLGVGHHGAIIPHGAAVRRNGKLVGRVIFEPYCVAAKGELVSLSGQEEAVVSVRADTFEGTREFRALG